MPDIVLDKAEIVYQTDACCRGSIAGDPRRFVYDFVGSFRLREDDYLANDRCLEQPTSGEIVSGDW